METSSEACQGRARFQHGEACCHQVFFFLQGKAPKEIHAILTETLACFLPGRAKDLPAPLYGLTALSDKVHSVSIAYIELEYKTCI